MKIDEIKKNIKTLNKLINEKKCFIRELNSILIDIKRNKLKYHEKHLFLKNRISENKNNLAKQNVAINHCLNQKSKTELNIQLLIREKLNSLTTFIYYIDEYSDNTDESHYEQDNSFNSEDTPLLSLLSDTSKTSPSKKKVPSIVKYKIVDSWVNLDCDFNLSCKLFEFYCIFKKN